MVSRRDARLRALVILVPGSNGDGRAQVDEPFWQAFATKHQLGLVGARLTAAGGSNLRPLSEKDGFFGVRFQ